MQNVRYAFWGSTRKRMTVSLVEYCPVRPSGPPQVRWRGRSVPPRPRGLFPPPLPLLRARYSGTFGRRGQLAGTHHNKRSALSHCHPSDRGASGKVQYLGTWVPPGCCPPHPPRRPTPPWARTQSRRPVFSPSFLHIAYQRFHEHSAYIRASPLAHCRPHKQLSPPRYTTARCLALCDDRDDPSCRRPPHTNARAQAIRTSWTVAGPFDLRKTPYSAWAGTHDCTTLSQHDPTPARADRDSQPAAMPYRLDTHVLTVDANVIHKVDTANPANLYSMWTVFSRCADSVEQGRRLENLSWRLWQREQLVQNEDNPVPATASDTTSTTQTLPRDVPSDTRLPEVPQLSGSVESLQDDEAVEFTSVSAPLEIRPRIRRLDSSTSSRSKRDRHISSDDFEKMIVSIVKDKAPLSAPTHTSPLMAARKELPFAAPAFERSGSTTTESQSPSKDSDKQSDDSHPSPPPRHATNVVRGFSPKILAFPQATQATASDDPIPEPSSSPAPKHVHLKKQPAKFALGGSCSSSEQGQSIENLKPIPAAAAKKPMFQIGGSSEEECSLKSALHSPRPASALAAQKKQTSFSNHVLTRTYDQSDPAVDSDTEAEYVDESAIDDDDDSSDWEDSIEDSGKSSVDEKFFQRVPSKVNLTSRPSLITLMVAQSERAKKLGNHASQSTSAIPRSRAGPNAPALGASPNDSDEAPLMMKGMRHPTTTLKPISEIPRSSAQPIAVAASHVTAQAAMSPRTTRRNMLATELTESLRRHLLWERQQKTSTANAVLKRRHTSHDVANLRQFPEKACMKDGDKDDATSWNQFFSKEALNGYHSKGW
ncbi:Uncharacterized protein TPAR_01334 [Tolypocladium paradoxum]|uniref:Nitrogen regulatory protein areA GATA-like domain-containing protein n=1 Tax=Tolypocladium paradoxum TaxID=94208 RepID=A0A2S4L7Q9_9HYPO|nr:Uncharacterized protein TPAR_01334 [Tolypocladium paradoxum]